MDDCSDVIDGAMLAVQIAFVRNNNGSKDRGVLPEEDRLYAESGKMQKR